MTRPSRDRVLPPLGPWRWLVAAVWLVVGSGAGGWVFAHPGRVDDYVGNELTRVERNEMLAWIGLAGVGFGLAVGVVAALRRRRLGRWDPFEAGVLATRSLFGMSALLPLAYLTARSLPTPLTFAVAGLIGITGAVWLSGLAGVRTDTVAHAGDAPLLPVEAPDPAAPSHAAWLAGLVGALGLWVGYAWFFSHLSITNHQALNTRTTDLGLYDNIFYHSIRGDFLGCSFIRAGYHGSAHFDPLLVLLSPLHLLHPRAELLLVLQSAWLGSTVVPLYLLAVRKLGSPLAGVVLACVFVLYPPLHGANMYEFHSLVLITPLVVWLLFAFETGSHVGYFVSLGALLLVREDVALLMCFVGVYVALTRRPGALLQGVVTVAVSLVYLVIVKTFFMTSSDLLMSGKDSYSFAYYYEALIPKGAGLRGLLTSLITNPVFALGQIFVEDKYLFVALVFGPLAFLPFFTHPGRVMLIYGLAFCLLATRRPVYSIHFQYATILFSVAFALVPIALAELSARRPAADRKRWVAAMLAVMLGTSVVLSWRYGALVENLSFRAGFHRVARELDETQREKYAWVRRMVGEIPADASVAATPRLGPHISNRAEAYNFTDDVDADYVFVNERELKKSHRKVFKELTRLGLYVRVDDHASLVLLRKVP